MFIEANDPARKSWVEIPAGSDFPIQNLPFGIFRFDGHEPRVGVAIGNYVVDLYELWEEGLLNQFDLTESILKNQFLNNFIRLGKLKVREIRNTISQLLSEEDNSLRLKENVFGRFLIEMKDIEMLMPVNPGDYTDFYSSLSHATNVGKMFRPDNPLYPNWKHMPIGYHGRCSSIMVSGQNFHRPMGQIIIKEGDNPMFAETNQLDFELEMAFITFEGKPIGQRISTAEAEDYIFGMVIFNDWSARDIQRYEYVPLGPFLGKNFASSVSPWVVTLDALEPFRVAGVKQDPAVLDYLKFEGDKNLDIKLEVFIRPENKDADLICTSNYSYLYWNMNQQLAHQTVNGCNIRDGDIYASGTISGETEDSFGSMMELTWRGTKPIKLSDGTERKFLLDHDTIIMKAHCEKNNVRVGFGEVRATILPAV